MAEKKESMTVYKDPRQHFVRQYLETKKKKDLPGPDRRQIHVRIIFLRVAELVVIGVSLFEGSHIVRFLTAKITMDVVVEITARFGPGVGHQVSTILASVVAEPKLIAVFVTCAILILEVFIMLIRLPFAHRRHRV